MEELLKMLGVETPEDALAAIKELMSIAGAESWSDLVGAVKAAIDSKPSEEEMRVAEVEAEKQERSALITGLYVDNKIKTLQREWLEKQPIAVVKSYAKNLRSARTAPRVQVASQHTSSLETFNGKTVSQLRNASAFELKQLREQNPDLFAQVSKGAV